MLLWFLERWAIKALIILTLLYWRQRLEPRLNKYGIAMLIVYSWFLITLLLMLWVHYFDVVVLVMVTGLLVKLALAIFTTCSI